MTMLKKGISYGPLIVSKMVFVCKSCNYVEIVNEKDYSPNVEKKCSKCQNIMILESSNTNTINSVKSVKSIDPNFPNTSGDYFPKNSK